MTHVSLFTGIGGLDLAAEWAGFETILQVERDEYALKVLEKHWPNVPRITDVREVNSESIERSVTIVSGGFPCQPFSASGKRRGTGDDRYLWPELLRIVEALRPAWVVGENVSGLLSLNGGVEIDNMLASLEARDYTPWILHHPAAGVGATHKRDRVFIVANNSCKGYDREEKTKQKIDGERGGISMGSPPKTQWDLEWKEVASRVCRMDDGIPHRVDRLRALGNAVVPQQAYPIFYSIAQTEKNFYESKD